MNAIAVRNTAHNGSQPATTNGQGKTARDRTVEEIIANMEDE